MEPLTFFHHVSEIADAITWGPTSMARLTSGKVLERIDSDWKFHR
eukprot:UN12060